MRVSLVVTLVLVAFMLASGGATAAPLLPVRFEPNVGQADRQVDFVGRAGGQVLLLSPGEATLVRAGGGALRMRFEGSRRAHASPEEPLAGRTNYLVGDRARWRRDVPLFGAVTYRQLYRGVDVRFHGAGGGVEYDLLVAPGADPTRVALRFPDAERVRVDEDGALVVDAPGGILRQRPPVAWQDTAGARVPVKVTFRVRADGAVVFDVGAYDRTRSLVIDPTVTWSTYLGGAGIDEAYAVTVGADGGTYVAGWTSSPDFPVGGMPYHGTLQGAFNAFVAKIDVSGASLAWATYLGGVGVDRANAIAVDATGNVHVAGVTASSDFPTSAGAAQTTFGGKGLADEGDAFYARLSPDGSTLLAGTFLGGSGDDAAAGLALDGAGGAWLVGHTSSGDLPLSSPFQAALAGGNDAFVAHLDGAAHLLFASYLGGTSEDLAEAAAADGSGGVWLVGSTASSDFLTQKPLQPIAKGSDAFVAHVAGTSLVTSTYLGGSDVDDAHAVAVDASGAVYVAGETQSTDFPVQNAVQPKIRGVVCDLLLGCPDAFIARLAPDGGSITWATFLGGSNFDAARAIAVDPMGVVHVAGETGSLDFPVLSPFQPTLAGGTLRDGFVALLTSDGSTVLGASYLGGTDSDVALAVAADAAGATYVVGTTSSADFPVLHALQGVSGNHVDAFVAKVAAAGGGPLAVRTLVPAEGGDIGPVTVIVEGSGFAPGATVELTRAGQPDIAGTQVAVLPDGTALVAVFQLNGAERGAWDVVVQNPGGAGATDPGGFTVEAGVPPVASCDLVGPSRDVIDVPTQYDVVFHNTGNVDALGMICNLTFPADATWTLQGAQIPTPEPPGTMIDYTQVPVNAVSGTGPDATRTVSLWLPRVPPQLDPAVGIVFAFPARFPTDDGQRRVFYWTYYDPAPPSTDADELAETNCMLAVESEVVNLLGALSPIPVACAEKLFSFVQSAVLSNGPGILADQLQGQRSWGSGAQLLAGGIGVVRDCVGATVSNSKIAAWVEVAIQAESILESCFPNVVKWVVKEWNILLRIAKDPNDLTGPPGAGASRWIAGDTPLEYLVEYANEASATAPAQEVVVTLPIDAHADLASFQLGAIRVAGQAIQPPPGAQTFQGYLDLRATQQVVVAVDAKLDTASRTATWTLRALDPATGKPPTDLFVGFLPPDQAPPQGEGSVAYSIAVAPGLTTGTPIGAQANVVFDTNAPVATPAWTNALDVGAPRSTMAALPSTEPSTGFDVSWSGTDDGSGIAVYTISVSDDGGAFQPWMSSTTTTSAHFLGQEGHSYTFRSQARDLVDNLETPTSTTSTTVTMPGAANGSQGCACRTVKPPEASWQTRSQGPLALLGVLLASIRRRGSRAGRSARERRMATP